MKKVLLIQPILSHYRQSLFELLASDPNIDIQIIAGKKLNEIQVFESKSEKITANLKNFSFSFKSHKFYWQKGLFSAINKVNPTNVIIGGPDFHFLSTILLSLYLLNFTRIKVHFWTHGLSKSNSQIIVGLTKYFYKRATSIFTYEQEGKAELNSKLGINKSKIFVIKNCLNEWDYGFNKKNVESKTLSSRLNILFSGRLTEAKHIDILIEAIKIVVDKGISVKCVIIGDGDLRIELENLVNKLDINKYVTFTGALYDIAVEEYFRTSDVFVLPGKVGLSVVHALSYGLPVITTSLPIHSPEAAILKHGDNAFLFDGQSAEELSKTIIRFYKEIKLDNKNFSENCVQSILKNGYTPKSMDENLIKGLIN